MSDKRLVHDILSEAGTTPFGELTQRRPISFIQHGNPEDGFTYEVICPFCAATLAFVPVAATKVIGGLYRVALRYQKMHWETKEHKDVAEFAVEVTQRPLNVQKPLTEWETPDERQDKETRH